MSRLRPEHRALLGLVALAVAGQGVRLALLPRDAPPGAVGTAATRLGRPGDPLAHRDSAARLGRPLAAGERIDADRAWAADLARLPGVGPGLAREIVADRDRRGPFSALAALDRVRGVGPALLARLAPHLTFSAPSPPPGSGVALPAVPAALQAFPALPPRSAEASGPQSARAVLNAGDSTALLRLPGIGPARAGAILAWRGSHGPFMSAADLARVPRVGAAAAHRLWISAVKNP